MEHSSGFTGEPRLQSDVGQGCADAFAVQRDGKALNVRASLVPRVTELAGAKLDARLAGARLHPRHAGKRSGWEPGCRLHQEE